jgi:MarR family transcriptional regulator, organic hydroperoxide resistance regulator
MPYYFWYGMRTIDDLGFLLANVSRRFNGQLVARFADAGYPEVRASFGAVLMPLFQQDDLRVGDLASQAGLSKQSLTGLLRECETAGLVERRRDPADGRAFRVRLTPRGRRFQRVAENVLRDLDADVVARLGRSDRDALIKALKGLMDL